MLDLFHGQFTVFRLDLIIQGLAGFFPSLVCLILFCGFCRVCCQRIILVLVNLRHNCGICSRLKSRLQLCFSECTVLVADIKLCKFWHLADERLHFIGLALVKESDKPYHGIHDSGHLFGVQFFEPLVEICLRNAVTLIVQHIFQQAFIA